MQMLGSIKATNKDMAALVDDLLTTFNTAHTNGRLLSFEDMHIQKIASVFYGVLIFSYDTEAKAVKTLPKFFNMPDGTDPSDPSTWRHTENDTQAHS